MDALSGFAKAAPYLKHPLVTVGFVLLLMFGIHRTLLKAGIIPSLSERSGSRIVRILLRYGFIVALVVIVLGFGLEFFKAHQESSKVNEIVERLFTVHQEQIAKYVRLEGESQQEIDRLRKALKESVSALIISGDREDIRGNVREALSELAEGKTTKAEMIFKEIAKNSEANEKDVAKAERHLGALVSLHDPKAAAEAFESAAQLFKKAGENRRARDAQESANIVSQDAPGQLRLRAFLSEGGEQVEGCFYVYEAEKDMQGKRKRINHTCTTSALFTLPAGNYFVKVTYGELTKSAEYTVIANNYNKYQMVFGSN